MVIKRNKESSISATTVSAMDSTDPAGNITTIATTTLSITPTATITTNSAMVTTATTTTFATTPAISTNISPTIETAIETSATTTTTSLTTTTTSTTRAFTPSTSTIISPTIATSIKTSATNTIISATNAIISPTNTATSPTTTTTTSTTRAFTPAISTIISPTSATAIETSATNTIISPTNTATSPTTTSSSTTRAFTPATSTIISSTIATSITTSATKTNNLATSTTSTPTITSAATTSPTLSTTATIPAITTTTTTTPDSVVALGSSGPPLGHKNNTKTSSCINYGCKIIKILYICARRVLYTVLCWGTPKKGKQTDLLTYLTSLPSSSTANFTKAPRSQCKFNKSQEKKIRDNPSGDEFDITLLFLCIKVACENVADLCSEAWHTNGDELENLVFWVKQQRNKAMHEELEITELEFLEGAKNLRKLLISTLQAAQKRFHKDVADLDAEIEIVNNDLDRIIMESDSIDDMLKYRGIWLQQEMVGECKKELSKRLKGMRNFNPVSFIMGSNLSLDVSLVFTDIEIEKPEKNCEGILIPYRNFLREINKISVKGSRKMKLVLLEGLAGAGKTTLITLMLQKWCDEGQCTIKSLHKYQLVLYVQCRDPSTYSYTQLLQRSLPNTFTKYRSLLEPLISQCRILVLVDGLDEASDASQKLLIDLLHQLDSAEVTFICTSRPERSQDFHNMASSVPVISMRIKGIPPCKRSVFVRKYHRLIKKLTKSGRDTERLVQLMEKLKENEYYRLPLNLVLVTWLYDQEPQVIDLTITQTELYDNTLRLTLKKLLQRLTRHSLTCNMDQLTRESKVNEWLQEMCLQQLFALAHNHCSLRTEAVQRLMSVCDALTLPPQEMLSSCLSLRTISPGVQQYSTPHKGLQDFYGALYVVSQLVKQMQQSSTLSALEKLRKSFNRSPVKKILQQATCMTKLDLPRLQNLLQQLTGLLHLHMNPIPNTIAREVVGLLQLAGVRCKEQWLDIIADTKAAPAILEAIARIYPTGDCVIVRDNFVKNYASLLPYLPVTKLEVDVVKDPQCLEPLLSSLPRHKCVRLLLRQHFHNPGPVAASDHIIHPVLKRNSLQWFVGQVSGSMSFNLPNSLTHLDLSLATNRQASIVLPNLHQLHNLQALGIHLAITVSASALTQCLPDVRNKDGYKFVCLYQSDLRETEKDFACKRAALLQPKQGYRNILFPRTKLDSLDWEKVIEGLYEENVMVEVITIPDYNVTVAQKTQLQELAQSQLAAVLAGHNMNGWLRS